MPGARGPAKRRAAGSDLPNFDGNAAATSAREKLLQRCTEADLDKIEEMIKELYKQELHGVPVIMRQQLSTDPPAKYFAEHYYLMLEGLPTVRLQPRVHPKDEQYNCRRRGQKICAAGPQHRSRYRTNRRSSHETI